MARMPQRRHYLFVCSNRRPDDNPKGSCAAKGSAAVHEALKAQVFQRNLARNFEARVCTGELSGSVFDRRLHPGQARSLLLRARDGR